MLGASRVQRRVVAVGAGLDARLDGLRQIGEEVVAGQALDRIDRRSGKLSHGLFLMPWVLGMITAMVRDEHVTREMSSPPLWNHQGDLPGLGRDGHVAVGKGQGDTAVTAHPPLPAPPATM